MTTKLTKEQERALKAAGMDARNINRTGNNRVALTGLAGSSTSRRGNVESKSLLPSNMGFDKIASNLRKSGAFAVENYAQGMKEATPKLESQARQTVRAGQRAAKQADGQRSPSRVWGGIGKNSVMGYVNALVAGQKDARAAGAGLPRAAAQGARSSQAGMQGMAGSFNTINAQMAAASQQQVASSRAVVASQNRFAAITNVASTAMTKVAAGAVTMGKALKNGSMKLGAATGALTGVVFAASMIEGPMQEMAQKIMPVTFGLIALQSLLPLLMNPIGLMIAAVVGVTAGLVYMNMKNKQAAQAAQDYAIASEGSAKALKEFAEGLGKIDPQAQWAQITAGVTEENREAFGKGVDFVKSESGQDMVERAKGLSGSARTEALLAELRLAIATGLVDKDTARAISQALAVELKDPALGKALVTGITSFTSGSADKQFSQQLAVIQDINAAMNIQQQITDDQIKQQERLAELNQKDFAGTLSKEETEELIDLTDRAQSGEKFALNMNAVAAAAGNLINNTQKLSQVQASANLAYREGTIDLEQYEQITSEVAVKQAQLAESLKLLQENVGDERFAAQMYKAAEALGMSSDEVKEVQTQVNALNDAIGSTMDAKMAQRISDNIAAGLLSGDLDKGLAGSALEVLTSDKPKYKVYVDLIQENPESTTAILKLLNTLENLPAQYKAEFEAKVASGNLTPQEMISLAEQMAVSASYFLDSATLSAEAYNAVMEETMGTDAIRRSEQFFIEMSKSAADALSGLNLEELNEISKFFEDNEKLKKDTQINFSTNENGKPVDLATYLKSVDIAWKDFAALPNIQKQIIVTAVMNLDALDAQMKALRSGGKDSMFSAGELSGLANQWSATMDAIDAAQAIGDNSALQDMDDSGGGGGERELDWLEQLLKDTKESKVLYGKLAEQEKAKAVAKLGWVEWLRKNTSLTEQAIQDLAKDDKARQKYAKMTTGEREQIDKMSNYNEFRSTRDEVRAKEQKQAEDTLVTSQLGNTLISEQIKKNQELTKLYMMGGVHKERALDLAERIVNVEKTESQQIAWQNQQLEKQEKLLMKNLQIVKMQAESAAEIAAEASVGRSQEAMQEQNKTLQAEADYIRKSQIRPIQDKIEAQQDLIKGIEMEADLLERGLKIYDDQIEAMQERVEEMQRADELMMRESEMLDHDLKLMGYREEAINKTYEERITALDKVAQLNQQIANQQRDQLGLADALSRGDVSAAAAAAQQMQQNQMQFAADQFRSQLENSRDRQISSLTGAESGMNREQITQRQRELEEASYYTSLKIRDIEDQIYNIEKQKAGEQAKINALLDTTVQYDDEILRLETEILGIENARLAEIDKIVAKNEEDLALIGYRILASSEMQRVAIAQETERQAMAKATRDLDVLALEMQESLGESIADNIRLMNAFGTAAARANQAIKTGSYTSVGAQNKAMNSMIADYTTRLAGFNPGYNIPVSSTGSAAVNGIMGGNNNYMNNNVNINATGESAEEIATIAIQKLAIEKLRNVGGQ